MNKKIIRVLSFVMALTLAFGVMAFAAEEKSACFKFDSSVTVKNGETVKIKLTLEGAKDVKNFSASEFEFDKTALTLKNAEVVKIGDPAIAAWKGDALGVAYSETQPLCEGTVLEVEFAAKKVGTHSVSCKAQINKEDVAVTAASVTVERNSEFPDVIVDETEEEQGEESEMTVKGRSKDSILLKINTNLAMAFGEMVEIDNTNASVVPYIVNGRTLVPLRFVSETLGAEVEWEEGWNYCFVKKNGKAIKITFNSADIEVDGEIITYDAPIQVVENRTMVPIRFISETLGYDVYWNEPNQIVAISPMDNPWVKERDAELSTINSMMVTLLLKRKL